jgi:predicted DNA-binding transcriptional regulator
MLVSELAIHIKRSERHIRERILRLTKKGILNREIEILDNRRLAYTYSLRPLDEILHLVKNRLLHEINEIEKIAAK